MSMIELYKLLNIIITLAPDAADAVKKALTGWGKASNTEIDISQLKPVKAAPFKKVDADIDAEIARLFK